MSAAGALVLTAALVWQSAYAGFSTGTAPVASELSTGTLALSDSDQGLAHLSIPGLKPGEAFASCLVVTSTGSLASAVKLYGAGRGSSQNVASYLTVRVDEGTGGENTQCTGFTPTATIYNNRLSNFPTTWASGVGTWRTAGVITGENRTYRIAITVDPAAPTTTKNGSAWVIFVWETRSAGGPR